jgi:hypothetical protein
MDKPWLNNDLWPRTLRSNARKSLIAAWLFAAFWNLIAWPSVVVLPGELAKGNWAALLVTLFPTVGLLLLFWSVKKTREWLKYGVTELTLDPYPGSIGGHVGGTLMIRGADARVPFEVTLECVRSHVTRSGGKRKRQSEVVWQARGIADTGRAGSAAEVRFRFDVPAGLPASEVPEGDEYHCWHLQIRSRQPDVNLERRFDIGVFPTAEASRELGVDTSRRSREVADRAFLSPAGGFDPAQRARLLAEHGLEVDQQDGWLRLYLRRGRQRGMAFMTAVVGAAFVAVMVFLPDEGFSTSVMRWAFGAFGLCLLALALYLPFNTLDVRISRQKLKRVRTWLGLVVRSQEIAPDELEELEIDKGSSTTSGARTTIHYELVGRGKFGRFKLIESIPDRILVEAIRRQVMLAAGLRPSAS